MEKSCEPKPVASRDAISIFCPGDSEDKRALRRRIHKAQGSAVSNATHSRNERARLLFWTAAQLASEWTFASASTEDLHDVIDCLARLFVTARALERLEGTDEN